MALNKRLNLSAYTIMHFIVDLSCIFYLMGMVYMRLPAAECIKAAVIYNMFAFSLPMVLGFAADILGKNAFTSCIGCLLILLNYMVIPKPWLSVAMIGIGNGLFHIGGGRQVLQDAEGKYAPSGVFIASGALGVYLGKTMSGNFKSIYYTLMCVLIALSLAVLLYLSVKQWNKGRKSSLKNQKVTGKVLLLSLCIFLVVIIRSYYGSVASYRWNNGFVIGLIFTLCVVAGKFTGGIIADKLGVGWASVISLLGAGLTALFAEGSPVIGCISIMLFNMTMPITLQLLADEWKEFPGFAFGSLMMALFIGTLPTMVFRVRILASPAGLLLQCIISLVLLLAVIRVDKKCML